MRQMFTGLFNKLTAMTKTKDDHDHVVLAVIYGMTLFFSLSLLVLVIFSLQA